MPESARSREQRRRALGSASSTSDDGTEWLLAQAACTELHKQRQLHMEGFASQLSTWSHDLLVDSSGVMLRTAWIGSPKDSLNYSLSAEPTQWSLSSTTEPWLQDWELMFRRYENKISARPSRDFALHTSSIVPLCLVSSATYSPQAEALAEESATEAEANRLLHEAYRLVAADSKALAFELVCKAIEQSLAQRSLLLSSSVLKLLDPKEGGQFLSLGVLRTTFRVRGQVAEWVKAAARVEEFLQTSGSDVARVMRGLKV